MSTPIGYGVLAAAALLASGFWWWSQGDIDFDSLVTATVTGGQVQEVVSVSGFVEADNTADLTFPTTGRISAIHVIEGAEVDAGALLATIGQDRLVAERQAAVAALTQAEAAQAELISGQTPSERAVTASTIAQAQSAWEQTVATELQKVQNALVALRSNNLAAYATDPEEPATAPRITGSYTCAEEGEYRLTVYRSGTDSGYSFTYEGLESGRLVASTDQPVPLGDCGLAVQFTADERYDRSEWVIPVPNTRSSTYLTFQTALDLAEQQAVQNIQAAKEALRLAENVALRDVAAPRVEALITANAAVTAAQADLARIDAQLADYSIYAPFAGSITNISKVPGEIATTEPFITLLANDAFTLVARIPEIDITRLQLGQAVVATFDANPSAPQTGTIAFVSPIATEIDGVAYFETKIALTEAPTWLRAGLNADVDIIIATGSDVPTLPQRFIEQTPDGTFVTILTDEPALSRQPVETGLRGTDGLVEVTNLELGTTVVAP